MMYLVLVDQIRDSDSTLLGKNETFHRGSVRAFHPAALDSIFAVPKNFVILDDAKIYQRHLKCGRLDNVDQNI